MASLSFSMGGRASGLALVTSLILGIAMPSFWQPAMAIDFCPATNAPQQSHAVTTAGTAYDTFGCVLGVVEEPTVFTIDLTGVPTTGAASSVVFTLGTVNDRSALVLQFPTEATAAGLIPLNVEVSFSVFESGAGLQVKGSFPPNSVLTISGNSFSVNEGTLTSWFAENFAAIALSAGSDNTQTLNANAQISISFNIIQGTGDVGKDAASVGISWRGGVKFADGARAQIQQNTILLTCLSTLNAATDKQACVVGVHIVAPLVFLGLGGSFAMDSNIFNITGGFLAALPSVTSGDAAADTVVSFNGNQGSVSTYGVFGTNMLTVGSKSLASNAQYLMNGNIFVVFGTTACGVGFGPSPPAGSAIADSATSLSGNSAFVLANSVFSSFECDVRIFFDRDVTTPIAGNSRFQISSNGFYRIDTLSSTAADAIEIHKTFSLRGGAVLSISANVWGDVPVPGARLLGFGSSSGSLLGTTGYVRICGNYFHGSLLLTTSMVQAVCADSIDHLIINYGCFLDITLTVPTLPSTTEFPTLPTGEETTAETTFSTESTTETNATFTTNPVLNETTVEATTVDVFTTTTVAETNATETTAAETTVAETTAAETTVAETNATETTVAETTVAETTIAETTAAETTIAETTAAETTAAETTVAETNATETTVAETTIAETTAAETTAAETTAAETTAAETTAAETNATETTVAETNATEAETNATFTTNPVLNETTVEATTVDVFTTTAATTSTSRPTTTCPTTTKKKCRYHKCHVNGVSGPLDQISLFISYLFLVGASFTILLF